MKKSLFILLFLSVFIVCNSQTTVYGLVQPPDLGVGLRIDQQIEYMGIYSSISYGNYRFNQGEFVNNHYKLALGGLVYWEKAFCSLGLCLHKYGGYYFKEGLIPKNTLIPYSFDIGIGNRIGNFVVAMTLDILKFDTSINFGYIIIKAE